jgi:hypothetical protein
MPAYVVDSALFHAEGAIVNWDYAARRLGIPGSVGRTYGRVIELRWMLNAALGMPTEPFKVWARPHSAPPPWETLQATERQLGFAAGFAMVTWSGGAMSRVSVHLQAPSGGYVFAFSGGPLLSNICAFTPLTNGSSTVELAAPVIDGLLISPGVVVTQVLGVAAGPLIDAASWTLIEQVGLPVKRSRWAGIGRHGQRQGLTIALTDAQTAAVERLSRGAPPFGWGPLLAPGYPAPPWSAPGFPALVQEVNGNLLDQLRNIVRNFPPDQQAAQTVQVTVPPPENSSGQQMNENATTSELTPLPMTLMAASIDPFLSLVLGFGTAYPQQGTTSILGEIPQDFMVTAHWENGLDGASASADYAAIVPAPTQALPPGPPANMAGQELGVLRPLASDGDWRDSVRVSWDRPPDLGLVHPVSFAAARAGVSPPAQAMALMDPRPSGGYRPIGINRVITKPPDPEFFRLNFIERELQIPANPGSLTVKYGAAVQDIYGQWTPWASVDQVLAQPDLEPVRIVRATLTPTAPASGSVCATSLELEFLWDWRIRSPMQITFTGLMYPAADHGSPPPSLVIPGGLDRSVAGGGAPLTVTFAGDVPSAPGATISPQAENGDVATGFGAAQGNDTRRYKLSLSGLGLDFASTGFIGMAIWAKGQEQIAPQRLTPWPDKPVVVSTGDPRPPVVTPVHVKLGSLPDATSSSHVQISWTGQSNAVGYFIYEASEAGLLAAYGLRDPAQSETLDQRLAVLRTAFGADPLRRPFTRLNSTALQETSLDITLPRGSTGIHLYIVLGISAGGVESDWPTAPNADQSLFAVAAPYVAAPAAPMIEVQRLLDTTTVPPSYTANILVTTRPGPRPVQIDLHRVRVDDAARELDTMGPPVTQVAASGGGWSVMQTPDTVYGPYISAVQGTDAPPGSWRRVWYRATAWSAEDDTRGALAGRSAASNAAWVVLPPPDEPVLSALLIGGGPGPADVVLQWTCASPVARTPLGPHLIAARARVVGTPLQGTPLLGLDSTLDALTSSEPAAGSGVWIVGSNAGVTTYRAIIRRAAVTDSVDFAVRITDPLGRTGAGLLTIGSGPADPPPDLENLAMRVIPIFPPRRELTFTSTSPIVAPLDGPYVLRVLGLRAFPFPPPPSLTLPLGSVPVSPPTGPLPQISIIRSVAGPPFTYTAATTAPVNGFVVRITAPDGTYAQKQVT